MIDYPQVGLSQLCHQSHFMDFSLLLNTWEKSAGRKLEIAQLYELIDWRTASHLFHTVQYILTLGLWESQCAFNSRGLVVV